MWLYCGCLETTWKPLSWKMMFFVTDSLIASITLPSHRSQTELELPFLTSESKGILYYLPPPY